MELIIPVAILVFAAVVVMKSIRIVPQSYSIIVERLGKFKGLFAFEGVGVVGGVGRVVAG